MFFLLAAISAGVLFLAHTAPFPFVLEGLRRGDSLWHAPVDPAAPTVYLTYDDGPNPTATPQLLDVLAHEQAAATFFLIDDHLTAEAAPPIGSRSSPGRGRARTSVRTPAGAAARCIRRSIAWAIRWPAGAGVCGI